MPTSDNPQELAPPRMSLSDDARELLWRFYLVVEKAQRPGHQMEHVRAYASKAAEQAARIAGVLTLWGGLDAFEVSLQAMSWGVTLAHFYLGEAQRLAETGLMTEETAKAEQLRLWLLDSWPHDVVLPSDILNKGPNALRERAKLTKPLELLVKAGWLSRLPEGGEVRGKMRNETYHIVKPLHSV
ncbi:Protein of unknown function [Antarctobacter heliothermus]|uniref:DUF3987 domain-containing protein n=2 Tax=Antarctobacter heliothermus TaxID=74033 RepID=A0A239LHT4_9RHOB|nr:Protein of unknown function [Antarctobacter heliothermus]